jgi:hypothetical protein
MTKDEALKLCLEYIETNAQGSKFAIFIKEALAQREQEYHAVNAVHKGQQCYVKTKPKEPEPVAFEKTVCPFCSSEWVTAEQHDRKVDRLERLPLTDEHKERLANAWFAKDGDTDVAYRKAVELIDAIEAAHGIKENT